MVHIWLRDESKPYEHRSALTPSTAKKLAEQGFEITIEHSDKEGRIFKDHEFDIVPGVKFAKSGSWPNAPKDAYILGLKELPEDDLTPLSHKHIHFAHCFKDQSGWKNTLRRFVKGGGMLLDLEFLTDDNGRRVAAFGYYAGFGGCALAVEGWARQIIKPGTKFPPIKPYPNQNELINHVKALLREAEADKERGKQPRILITGALGRCGTGAVDFARTLGIPEKNILKWDMNETARGGPFSEIAESDIFVNCIYLRQEIPKFTTIESLNESNRNLRTVCDVSCDATNPFNPIPIYTKITSFSDPAVFVEKLTSPPPLEVISIDHIPSYLPREASEAYSHDLLPTLQNLLDFDKDSVWQRAKKLYEDKVEQLQPIHERAVNRNII